MLPWLYLDMSHSYVARYIRIHVKLHQFAPLSILSLTRDKTLPEFEIARSSSRELGKPLPNLACRNSNLLLQLDFCQRQYTSGLHVSWRFGTQSFIQYALENAQVDSCA